MKYSRRSVLAMLCCGLSGCTDSPISSRQTTKPETQTQSPSPTLTGTPSNNQKSTDTRTVDSQETRDFESAVVYIPFAGDKFGRCTDVCYPEVGQYGDPIPQDVVAQHTEWLAEANVSSVMFNFGESKKDYERLETFLDANLHSLLIEPFYVISQAIRRERDIESDFQFLRENLLATSHANTIDGRPVVTFWDFDFLAWGGSEASNRAMQLVDDHGGPEGFVDYLREQLSVDGREPFLVGDFFDNAIGGFPDRYAELNKQLDGATNWINAFGDTGQVGWEYARDHAAINFEATREFCDLHDMHYYPMVYPGFDDRHNSCWGSDRHIPRGPEHLRDLFTLAEKHTTGRVNIATFNDWTEGHQIEPGKFRDVDYGADYLDVVRDFSTAE